MRTGIGIRNRQLRSGSYSLDALSGENIDDRKENAPRSKSWDLQLEIGHRR